MTMPYFLDSELSRLQQQFERAAPQDILQWAAAEFGDQLALVTSFQPTGIVTLHMLQALAPQTRVFTLDTGYLFPETVQLIDQLEAQFDLILTRVRPDLKVTDQEQQLGNMLWRSDPDLCCHVRKTLPLQRALQGYTAWITGLRRDQSPARANTPVIAWDERRQMVKLCPFATWAEDMIWTYLHAHDLPYNKLHTQGYPSIGCWPCTKAVAQGEDQRSGRWAGQAKTECGLHFNLIQSGSGD